MKFTPAKVFLWGNVILAAAAVIGIAGLVTFLIDWEHRILKTFERADVRVLIILDIVAILYLLITAAFGMCIF